MFAIRTQLNYNINATIAVVLTVTRLRVDFGRHLQANTQTFGIPLF